MKVCDNPKFSLKKYKDQEFVMICESNDEANTFLRFLNKNDRMDDCELYKCKDFFKNKNLKEAVFHFNLGYITHIRPCDLLYSEAIVKHDNHLFFRNYDWSDYGHMQGDTSTPETTSNSTSYSTEIHRVILQELSTMYAKKNADYGDSFHKTFLEEGMTMPRIRLSDKLERFKRLTKTGNQEVKDESIRDTLLDLANYAIMTVMELDRERHEN